MRAKEELANEFAIVKDIEKTLSCFKAPLPDNGVDDGRMIEPLDERPLQSRRAAWPSAGGPAGPPPPQQPPVDVVRTTTIMATCATASTITIRCRRRTRRAPTPTIRTGGRRRRRAPSSSPGASSHRHASSRPRGRSATHRRRSASNLRHGHRPHRLRPPPRAGRRVEAAARQRVPAPPALPPVSASRLYLAARPKPSPNLARAYRGEKELVEMIERTFWRRGQMCIGTTLPAWRRRSAC